VMKPSQRLANLRGKNKVFEWFIWLWITKFYYRITQAIIHMC
jgi:hypothetical protein